MTKNNTHSPSGSSHAFQQGMMLALGVALVPLGIVSIALFLSGHQPGDFDTNLRYGLLACWIAFLLSVDRLSKLAFVLRFNAIPGDLRGQLLTILALSVLLPALRLDADMAFVEMARTWASGFFGLLAVLLVLFSASSKVHKSWQRAQARKRDLREQRRARR